MLVELNEMTCSNGIWTRSACTRTDCNSSHKRLIVSLSAGEHSPSILTQTPLALSSCFDADLPNENMLMIILIPCKDKPLNVCSHTVYMWLLLLSVALVYSLVRHYLSQTSSLFSSSPHLCVIVSTHMRISVFFFVFILSLLSPAIQQRGRQVWQRGRLCWDGLIDERLMLHPRSCPGCLATNGVTQVTIHVGSLIRLRCGDLTVYLSLYSFEKMNQCVRSCWVCVCV